MNSGYINNFVSLNQLRLNQLDFMKSICYPSYFNQHSWVMTNYNMTFYKYSIKFYHKPYFFLNKTFFHDHEFKRIKKSFKKVINSWSVKECTFGFSSIFNIEWRRQIDYWILSLFHLQLTLVCLEVFPSQIQVRSGFKV